MKDQSDDYKAGYRAGQRDMRFALEHLERLQVRHSAWTAGAMAMREACARYIEGEDEMFADNGLRALPIPEER